MAVKEFKFKLSNVRERKLSLLHDTDDNSLQVLVDGVLAGKDEKGTRYVIEDDNGNGIVFEAGLDDNWKPWLKANGEDIHLAMPLAWYQWIWIGLPIVLVFTGGMIGGMIGGAATYLNMVIMQAARPAIFRYVATLSVSIASVFCYLVLVVLLSIVFGTKEGKSIVDSFKKGYESVAESVKPEPSKSADIPNAYLDNGSASVLEFSVDGKSRGELKPFSYSPLNLKPGKHKFVFTENKKEFDAIDAQIENNKACVINPKGLSSYVIEKASYSSFTLVYGSGGTSYENVKGQKTASADFGLNEALPEKIHVKVKPGETGKTELRTKLLRVLPVDLSSQQAYAILKDEAISLKTFYYDGKEKFMICLLTALGKEPKKPEYRDMLLDYSKKTERYVLEAALRSLSSYADEIPDETLLALAMSDEKVNSSGMSMDSPAVNGRSGWAMKILLKRGKLALLTKDFSKLQKSQQATLLRVTLMEGSDSLKKSLTDSVLDSPAIQDEFMLSSLLGIIASKEFSPDEAQMEKIDAMISKIELDRVKKHWEKTWQEKIQNMAAAGASNGYINKKIMETFKSPDRQDYKVLVSFVKNGNYKPVMEIFGTIPGYAKLDVLRSLPHAKDGKVPDEALAIAWMIVDDKDENMSRYGLEYLSVNYPSPLEFLRKSWAYAEKLSEEKRKKKFISDLMGCSYQYVDKMSPEELYAVMGETPSEEFVKSAIRKLERDSDNRPKNFSGLAKFYPSIKNENNRTMIMRQMQEVSYLQFAFRKQDEFNAFRDLFQLGLDDKSASVKVPALEAAFKMQSADFPSDETAQKIIAGVEGDTKKLLQKRYDAWTIQVWRDRTRDRNYRAKALMKLSAILERTDDKDIAKFANSSLDHPDPMEKDYIDALIRIADKNNLADARSDSLMRLSSLGDKMGPTVLAQMMKSLDDPDRNVKYQAFTLLSYRIREDKEGKVLARMQAVAVKETDPKTKADMERILKSYLPAAPAQPVKQQKTPVKR